MWTSRSSAAQVRWTVLNASRLLLDKVAVSLNRAWKARVIRLFPFQGSTWFQRTESAPTPRAKWPWVVAAALLLTAATLVSGGVMLLFQSPPALQVSQADGARDVSLNTTFTLVPGGWAPRVDA